MLKRTSAAIAALTLALSACATLRGGYSVPSRHPQEIPKGRPVCSECHKPGSGDRPYQRFDHTPSFAQGGHRHEAGQDEGVCSMCHPQSYCNDCHVTRTELKPSDRRATDTYRQMPHRGDYRSRHRVDGRLDPVSCFGCHGNPKAAQSCATCHGK